jgi:hypothetical protein
MPKANDTDIYSFDEYPSLLDYLFGTDASDYKKNKSYRLNSIIQLINGVNGKNNMQFIFSDGSNIDATYYNKGLFFTDNNEVTPGGFTKLILNKESLQPIDLTELFTLLSTLENVVIKLENPINPNNVFNFIVTNITDEDGFFVFDVVVYNGFVSGSLINEAIYSLYFDVRPSVSSEDNNKIITETGFAFSGSDLIVNANWSWKLFGIIYSNPLNVTIPITYCASGKSRIDYIVPNTDNGFTRISGPESTTTLVAPEIPNENMYVTYFVVTDGVVETPAPTITGNTYISKNEQKDILINEWFDSQTITFFPTDGTSYRIQTISESGWLGKVYNVFDRPFNGQEITITNETGSAFLIKHGVSAISSFKNFLFPNEQDFNLEPNVTIKFKYLNGSWNFVGIVCYTKAESNTIFAPKNNPTFTGNVVVPNATEDNEATNLGQLKFPSNTPNTTIALGGIPIDEPLANRTPISVLTQLLVKFLDPLFTAFSMAQSQLIEVGVALSGNKTFNWTTTNPTNIVVNSLIVTDVTSNTVIGTGLANDGTEVLDIGTITNTSPITRNWNIKGTDLESKVFTSANFTVNSIYPIFYGVANSQPTANQALINSGTKSVVQSTGTLNVTFGASGQFLWFAHPASNTTKTKWYVNALNNGNIGTISDLFNAPTTVSVTTVLWAGVSYNIYISNFATTTVGNMELKNS